MRTKIKFAIYLLIFSIFNSSCTMIVLSTLKKQEVNVNTPNENASVYFNNEEVGKGKSFTTKIVKDGSKQAVVKADGYKEDYQVVLNTRKEAILVPCYFLDIIPIIYTGGAYIAWVNTDSRAKKYEPKINLGLNYKYSDYSKKDENKFLQVNSIGVDIKDIKKDIKTLQVLDKGDLLAGIKKAEDEYAKEVKKESIKNKKNPEKKLLSTENNEIKNEFTYLTPVIEQTLVKTGFTDTVNKLFKDQFNTIYLKGNIIDIREYSITANYPTSPNYYKFKITVKWYLNNVYDEVLDSIVISNYTGDFTYSFLKDEVNHKTMYKDAIEINYFNLLKSPELAKYIKYDNNRAINDEVLKITSPKTHVKSVQEAMNACVIVKRKDKGHGSGFAISEDGYILTNYHVITSDKPDVPEKLTIVLSTGEEFPAKVVRYNKARDIALLKIDHNFKNAFLLSNTKTFNSLTEVYTIGAPKSIELGQTVTLGLISNERNLNNNEIIQLSMSINSGNSGGAIFEKSGVLHGVVRSKIMGFSTEGLGFAIPSYKISEYLNIEVL